jgi:chromosome transmission fidelity protein 1
MCYLGKTTRHIIDYVANLLVDTCYTSRFGPQGANASPSRLASKLPRWIKERLVNVTRNFGEMHRLLHQIFKLN